MVLAGFFGYGITLKWGADQWGPFSEWVAGALTLAAVVVALRESLRGQRARAVDHEVARRRECMKAVADMWTGLAQMTLHFVAFTDYLQNLPERFNPNLPRQDNVPADHPGEAIAFDISLRVQAFVIKWTELVEPPLFIALALLKNTPFDQPMKDINTGIRDLLDTELAKVLQLQLMTQRPDITALDSKWSAILRNRERHLNLAREHFSLDLQTVEAEMREPPESPTPRVVGRRANGPCC